MFKLPSAIASSSILRASAVLVCTAAASLTATATPHAQSGAQSTQSHWVSTWGGPPSSAADSPGTSSVVARFNNQTLRLILRSSAGGSQVRIRLSNVFGSAALNVGSAHVALRSGQTANTVAGSDRPLTFSGQTSFSIPPGALVLSDPVNFTVPMNGDLAVSIFFPDTMTVVESVAANTHQTSYVSGTLAGDQTAAATFTVGSTLTSAPCLTGVEVLVDATVPTFVCFGDSITEGVGGTTDTNHRWPDFFKERLFAQGRIAGVINQGIAGGQATTDWQGPGGQARFDRDVLTVPGATHAIVLLGINDVNAGQSDVIGVYREFIARAHENGVKIIGCTLLPFDRASTSYYSAAKDVVRVTINNFIRNSAEFDGMVDFDRVMGDPNDPSALNSAYDSGDGLHPNDAGKQAMGNAIDLTLFNGLVTLNSVVSRKIHGSAGTFDLPLPQGLFSTPAIESRGGGANDSYTLVFSFAAPVTSILGTAVAEGVGTVSSTALDPNDARNVIVTLTGVTSSQYVTVGLTNVSDGVNTSSVRATFGVLVGDVGGNGTVNAADVAQAKSLSGQATNAQNFLSDLNEDGVINAADVAFAKSKSGNSLPAAPTNVNP